MKQHISSSQTAFVTVADLHSGAASASRTVSTQSWGRKHKRQCQSLSSWPTGWGGRAAGHGCESRLRGAALLLTLVFIKEPGRSEHVWLSSIRHGLSVHENPSAKHQRTSSRPPVLSESRPDRQGERPHTIKSCAQSAFGIFHLALHLAFDIYSLRVMLSDQLLDTASQQGKGL